MMEDPDVGLYLRGRDPQAQELPLRGKKIQRCTFRHTGYQHDRRAVAGEGGEKSYAEILIQLSELPIVQGGPGFCHTGDGSVTACVKKQAVVHWTHGSLDRLAMPIPR